MTYTVRNDAPDPAEYCGLRRDCGLSEMDEAAAAFALPRSLYAVTVRDGEQLVAMGRLVGDGLHVQVVDIAVHPDSQRRGLSRLVLDRVMDYVERSLPACTSVSLFADVDWLYQKWGFQEPNHSTGMFFRRPDVSSPT